MRTNIDNDLTFSLAKAFQAPVVLHSELRDGSLRAVAQEQGIPILLYEAGEALRFDEIAIRIGVKGIVNVLRTYEMLPKSVKIRQSKTPIVSRISQWIRSSESGMIRTIKALGDTVQKDEIIAYIDEPLGRAVLRLRPCLMALLLVNLKFLWCKKGMLFSILQKLKIWRVPKISWSFSMKMPLNKVNFMN